MSTERLTALSTPYTQLLHFVDPYCPRETQPMPTVQEPGPAPFCTCGLHEILDGILRMDRAIRELCEQRDKYKTALFAQCEDHAANCCWDWCGTCADGRRRYQEVADRA